MKFALFCGISFAPTMSVLYAVLRWINPCNSGTVGYHLIPSCTNLESEWDTFSKLLLLAICILSFWFYVDAGGSLAISMMAFSFVQVYCLRRCVQHVLSPKVSKEESSTFQGNLSIYRQIQVLSRYYNLAHQDGLVSANLFLVMVGFIIGLYTLIALGFQMTFPQMWFFAVCSQDGILVILLYTTVMGQLYIASNELIAGLKGNICTTSGMTSKEMQITKRCMNSLRPVKCYIGHVNFIDELSPLNFVDFCINQLVSLLMMQ